MSGTILNHCRAVVVGLVSRFHRKLYFLRHFCWKFRNQYFHRIHVNPAIRCRYYSGEKVAPVLTIFIGGNHEASNYLQELPYGGWVAPNIYYIGYASVVTIGGIRIAGLSGIFKNQHWMQGHYEKPPYSDSTIRSVYHIRNLEVFRLKQVISFFVPASRFEWTELFLIFPFHFVALRCASLCSSRGTLISSYLTIGRWE